MIALKRIIIHVLALLVITACYQNKNVIRPGDPINLKAFHKFIKKFKPLKLPYTTSTSCFEPDSMICVALDMENDSAFLKYSGPAITIGILPDTSNFYSVIYCTAGACYMPVLSVFSKNGVRISTEPISHGCGADAGYICSDSLYIRSFFDITSKLVEDNYEIDNNGNTLPNTLKRTITIDEFSINEKGIITKKVNINSY